MAEVIERKPVGSSQRGRVVFRVDRVYGNLVVYPACENSRILASIAGTKTLTLEALAKIALLGFDIAFAPGSEVALNHQLNELLARQMR